MSVSVPSSASAALRSDLHSGPRSSGPLIALTPYHNLQTDEPYMRPAYPEAILHAGGIPVTLPLTDDEAVLLQLVSAFDAFLFTGGPDVHPFYFHEEAHRNCGNISAKRDRMELLLLKLAMEAKKPILGICRGIQVLNIGLGGDIYQNIPEQFSSQNAFSLAHSQPFAYDLPAHTVAVTPGTLLAELAQRKPSLPQPQLPLPNLPSPQPQLPLPNLPSPQPQLLQSDLPSPQLPQSKLPLPQPEASAAPLLLSVNSMHHQAVRRLAPGLTASGRASDGIIEAIESPGCPTFFLGVQWHPEYLWKQDEAAARIFTRFVQSACK